MWACLSDCCFLGNGKWNKETQKVQRHWTANYEQEGGKRRLGEEEEEEECFSYGRHVPPNPVLPLSCSSILYTHCCFSPSSVVSCLRCSVFFHLQSYDSFVLCVLVSHHHIRDITLGGSCRWWLGLWVLYMIYFLETVINTIFHSCVSVVWSNLGWFCSTLLNNYLQLVCLIKLVFEKNGTLNFTSGCEHHKLGQPCLLCIILCPNIQMLNFRVIIFALYCSLQHTKSASLYCLSLWIRYWQHLIHPTETNKIHSFIFS